MADIQQVGKYQEREYSGNGRHLAKYVYCVAPANEITNLGNIGIDEHIVYTVAYGDLCAIVHECSVQPYDSNQREVIEGWVAAHHRVVDIAWKRWGTVIPATFNTIISPAQYGAEENVKVWLQSEYQPLSEKLKSLTGKAEYGVQVFWDTETVARDIAGNDSEVLELKKEIEICSQGIAYMYRHKLESLLKKKLEIVVSEKFKKLYGELKESVDAIRVEKARKAEDGRQMLMNLSCLVFSDGVSNLKARLNIVDSTEGFSVRLIGPLPTYSFC